MIRVIGLVLMFGTIVLAACGGSESTSFVPLGMAQGQPTFVYIFTEN